MGRVREIIKVDGRECWTLFDTGARNTYVVPAVADVLITSEIPSPIRTALGGRVKETNRTALLQGELAGHLISSHALVVDEIGADEDGRPIEILFGALAMQQWGIRPVPDEEKLDLTHYPALQEEFRELGIDLSEAHLLLKRVITKSGCRCYVNASLATLTMLHTIGQRLFIDRIV